MQRPHKKNIIVYFINFIQNYFIEEVYVAMIEFKRKTSLDSGIRENLSEEFIT